MCLILVVKGVILLKEFILFKTVERFLGLLLSCFALSALMSFLCICGIIPDGSTVLVVSLYVIVVLFAIINIGMMRRTYYELKSYRKYLVVNICAYVAFVAVNLISYKLFSKVLYTWLFGITKTVRYSAFNLSTLKAIGLFHLIMLAITFVASAGMDWVKYDETEEQELLENAPGFLEPELLKQENNTDKKEENSNS